ncbi:ADP-ribosylglycohydrolase [Sulfurihydrogenibium azorense Az-Fu1]|uniref:ADP-ribosylglycohydrolase n=1 Tax=Sulfurihydrogenibium azorense (strain DSM 15241 / OCM 825 / Az-Fu1) TaxID=204536 RepID=C1DWW8_SULAA|nr:ADP-ribosylglycohydrolase family protein [Sulfurihydrogenibium azorense]ACN98572.1 ADP-ribosylglycohydrolase [Sulfurihydrogenibium azorense Az-Fu1]
MEDKFIGAFLGAAVGDSLGMMVEELPIDDVIEFYGEPVKDLMVPHPSSPSYFLRPGENTSEFEIITLVAKSIIDRKMIDIKDIIEKYIQWLENSQVHTYVDPHFLLAIQSILEGRDIEKGGSTVDHALPAIPIGLYHYKNPYLAVEAAKAVCMLTTRNELVLDVASAICVAISELVQEKFYLPDENEYFVKHLKNFTFKNETKHYLNKVINLLKEDADYEKAINELGNGSFVLESFSQALFIFLKTPHDTETVIVKAANSYGYYGGDTDSIALLSGLFAGAYNSEESIPERWKENLLKKEYIIDTAKKLYQVALH